MANIPESVTPRLTPRLLVVLGLLIMLGPLATSAYVPGLPNLAANLSISSAQAELTITACLVGLALGQLIVGPISDRYGRRRPILIGISMFILSSLLCAIAPTLGWLLLFRLVQGFAGAVGIVVARAAVRDLAAGTAAAVALSRLLMVTGIAPVIGPIITGQFLRFADWRVIFLVLAAAAVLSLVTTALWFPETLPPERRISTTVRKHGGTMLRLLRDRDVLASMAVIGLMGGLTFSWMASGPFYFDADYGMSAQWFAVLTAVSSIAFVIGAQVNTSVVKSIGVRRALMRGLLFVSIFAVGVLALGLMHDSVWLVVASGVLSMGTYGGMGANAQALALTPHGEVAGTVSAMLGMMQFVGGGIIPPLMVLLVGDEWAMGAGMAVAGVGALLVAVFLTRPMRYSSSA